MSRSRQEILYVKLTFFFQTNISYIIILFGFSSDFCIANFKSTSQGKTTPSLNPPILASWRSKMMWPSTFTSLLLLVEMGLFSHQGLTGFIFHDAIFCTRFASHLVKLILKKVKTPNIFYELCSKITWSELAELPWSGCSSLSAHGYW